MRTCRDSNEVRRIAAATPLRCILRGRVPCLARRGDRGEPQRARVKMTRLPLSQHQISAPVPRTGPLGTGGRAPAVVVLSFSCNTRGGVQLTGAVNQ